MASDVTTIKSKPVLKVAGGLRRGSSREALDRGIESAQKLMLDRNATA